MVNIKSIKNYASVSNILNIKGNNVYPKETVLRILANHFELLDQELKEFIDKNPKIYLEENKLVLRNSSSLFKNNVSESIKILHDRICDLIESCLYIDNKLDCEQMKIVIEQYNQCYIFNHYQYSDDLYETVEFHSQYCKLFFHRRN